MEREDLERLIAATEEKAHTEARVHALLQKLEGQLAAVAETNSELRAVIRELCIGNTDVSAKLDAVLTLIAAHVRMQQADLVERLVPPATTVVVEAGTRFEGETTIDSEGDTKIVGRDLGEGE